MIDSTLPVTQIERRGRTASWLNIAPGALGLVFNNYRRVLNEPVEIGSGDTLFGHRLRNSFLTAAGRIVMILTVATLAGYALARLKFRGFAAVFAAVIFSMTIPPKVTFISNYSSMIYVTHDEVEAMTLATRIVVLVNKGIAQVGSPLQLMNAPRTSLWHDSSDRPP